MEYLKDTQHILSQAKGLKETLREMIREILREGGNNGILPLFTTKHIAGSLKVSDSTIRDLVRAGELHPRIHKTSGRSYRFLFTYADVEDFVNRNFPALEDLGRYNPRDPRSNKIRGIEKLVRLKRLLGKRRHRRVASGLGE